MDTTSVTLLERLRRLDEQAAWSRFVDLYTPVLAAADDGGDVLPGVNRQRRGDGGGELLRRRRRTGARRYAQALRGRWGVEGQLHWQLDVSSREGASRVGDRRGAANLALMRKLAYRGQRGARCIRGPRAPTRGSR
jgi:hypothetical protein